MTDEREGLPSGSTIGRTLECPAWLSRAAVLPALKLADKAWTTGGIRAHEALADDTSEEDLDGDIEDAVRICREKLATALIAIGWEEPQEIREQRMFLHDDNGEPVASGKPDRIYIQGNQFFAPDFKTGRKDVLPPAQNAQLIFYALLAQEQYGVNEGYLAIIPAWKRVQPMAFIGPAQLAEWRTAILGALTEAKGEHPRAKATAACDYCPCRWACPEAWEVVQLADQLSTSTLMHDTPETILLNYDTAKHAEGTIKAYTEALKAMITEAPDAVPGLKIGKGSEIKTIPGSEDTFNRLTEILPLDVVLRSIKFTPASLAKAKTGGKGAKAYQQKLENDLAEIIETKPKAGALERV
jgi:hypothetical protein